MSGKRSSRGVWGLIAPLLPATVASVSAAPLLLQFGGPGDDYGKDVAVDLQGNVILAGYFAGAVDFDPGPGVAQRTASGVADLFVVKMTDEGEHLWSFSVGGPAADMPHSVVPGSDGSLYLTGYFSGAVDFDPGPGIAMVQSEGLRDGFLARYSPEGELLWAFRVGGPEDDEGMDVAVDGEGNVWVTGVRRDASAGEQVFLARCRADGSNVWNHVIGGPGADQGCAVEVAPDGSVTLSGLFSDTVDFDPGPGNTLRTSAGGRDGFVARYSPAGELRWVTPWGGRGQDFAAPGGIASDGADGVWITGRVMGRASGGGLEVTSAGAEDVLLAHLAGDGQPSAAHAFGGSAGDGGHRVVLDPHGNLAVAGWFRNTADFDPGPGVVARTGHGLSGASDAFVASYTPQGTLRWAQTWGGPITPEEGSPRMPAGGIAAGLTVDLSGRVLATGRFYLDTDFGLRTMTSRGRADALLIRLLPSGLPE